MSDTSGIKQIIETDNGDGWTTITAITENGNSNSETYFLDCDRENALDRAIEGALDKD